MSDCNVCAAGFGDDSSNSVLDCQLQCGVAAGAEGTFGTPDRPIGTKCESCSPIKTGFYFVYATTIMMYKPPVVTRPRADSRGDCLAEFGQIGDVGAWYLGGTARLTLVPGANTLEECATACRDNPLCQYITFDYSATTKCSHKLNTQIAQAAAG